MSMVRDAVLGPHSRCLWSLFNVEYSSLSSFPTPSSESIFGIELEGGCFLCGGTELSGFSTTTSPMVGNKLTGAERV